MTVTPWNLQGKPDTFAVPRLEPVGATGADGIWVKIIVDLDLGNFVC